MSDEEAKDYGPTLYTRKKKIIVKEAALKKCVYLFEYSQGYVILNQRPH